MSKQPTFQIKLNLSASQARKRLKGHGFGVKEIQATDRNQSVITHTATGEHLLALESLLADVIAGNDDEGVSDPDSA